MSDGPDGTAEVLAEIRRELAELRSGYESLREASTPAEKQEAREEIAEAKADLDALAAKTGISRGALEHAMAEARKAERREELSPIVKELIEEHLNALAEEDDEDSGASKNGDDGEGKNETPTAEHGRAKKPSQEPPKNRPDSEPVVPHWSERKVEELLR